MNNYNNKTLVCGEIKKAKAEYNTPKREIVSQQTDEEYEEIEAQYFLSFEERKRRWF